MQGLLGEDVGAGSLWGHLQNGKHSSEFWQKYKTFLAFFTFPLFLNSIFISILNLNFQLARIFWQKYKTLSFPLILN
jgi:hypothetical protein